LIPAPQHITWKSKNNIAQFKKLIACLVNFNYNGPSFRRKVDSIETKEPTPEYALEGIFSLPVFSCLYASADYGLLLQFLTPGFIRLQFSIKESAT
jgi:hypothetical protein